MYLGDTRTLRFLCPFPPAAIDSSRSAGLARGNRPQRKKETVIKTCKQCGAVNNAEAATCCFCDAPLTQNTTENSVSAPPRPKITGARAKAEERPAISRRSATTTGSSRTSSGSSSRSYPMFASKLPELRLQNRTLARKQSSTGKWDSRKKRGTAPTPTSAQKAKPLEKTTSARKPKATWPSTGAVR